MTDILLYCGVSEKRWNGVPITPGGYACISPISGKSARTKRETSVYVPPGTNVIQDSGSFSDNWSERLSFPLALERQQKHALKYGYADQITHRATYDLLIDEVWNEGNREKRRWSVTAAEAAIDETVNGAGWLNQHRDGQSLIISAQGVDGPQYLRCVQRLLPLFQAGDVLGLGGWCIIGKMPRQMMTVFTETVNLVIPFIAGEGIPKVHIWGVIYPPALAVLLSKCLEYDVKVSTDSMGVSLNPVWQQWGYGSWRNNRYQRPELDQLGQHRAEHAALTRAWLEQFTQSVDYAVTLRQSALSHFPAGKCDRCCEVCGGDMSGKRAHAVTCSQRCRKALSRK